MPRKLPRGLWLILPLTYLLYFHHLSAAGLIGPDEPRYAAIGRAMARTGDWITPRLWGVPWLEKPALLYWMTGVGFKFGLGPELAPRLPVAILAVCFLVFFWWIARREFGERPAAIGTLILGSCGAWILMSQVGATDIPLAATFSAAMLLVLPYVSKGDQRFLAFAGACLGLAVLAKGLVGFAMAAPLVPVVWWARRRLTELAPAALRVTVPLLIVAVPWYLLCYQANGAQFLNEFFWKHHVSRMTSPDLGHVQPFWYYVAEIFPAAVLPWTPLLLLVPKAVTKDPRRVFLVVWLCGGLLFFSAATNKLPGYILPLVPPAALLCGLALEKVSAARYWLAACALLLIAFPIAAQMLPATLAWGFRKAPRPEFNWTWLAPLVIAAAVWILERQGRRVAAVGVIAAGAALGMAYVKQSSIPQLERLASARSLWLEISSRRDAVCIAPEVHRAKRLGLNYYAETPLPECSTAPGNPGAKPLWIRQSPDEPPFVTAAPAAR
jgi:4-amino-4-deoxy-L-arabinose transferase-like glycosyltransferase